MNKIDQVIVEKEGSFERELMVNHGSTKNARRANQNKLGCDGCMFADRRSLRMGNPLFTPYLFLAALVFAIENKVNKLTEKEGG